MGCCCNNGTNFNTFSPSFGSGIPSASAQFTVGNQTRFFSSNPCCQLNAQRFLLNVDQCCSFRYSVPPIPITFRGSTTFI